MISTDDHEFTEISFQEVETNEVVDSNDPCTTSEPASSTSQCEPDNSTLTSTTTVTVASRRHKYPVWLPILTMLRYSATIWVSEVATTGFENPCIHHSAVRIMFPS